MVLRVVPANAGTHTPRPCSTVANDFLHQLTPVVMSFRFRGAASTYIVAPSTQGANSAPPKSKLSLLVGCPEAVFSISSKMRWPHCCTVSSPSRMVPQLTSMSSSMGLNIAELVARLMGGAGLHAETLPRPGVERNRFD